MRAMRPCLAGMATLILVASLSLAVVAAQADEQRYARRGAGISTPNSPSWNKGDDQSFYAWRSGVGRGQLAAASSPSARVKAPS